MDYNHSREVKPLSLKGVRTGDHTAIHEAGQSTDFSAAPDTHRFVQEGDAAREKAAARSQPALRSNPRQKLDLRSSATGLLLKRAATDSEAAALLAFLLQNTSA